MEITSGSAILQNQNVGKVYTHILENNNYEFWLTILMRQSMKTLYPGQAIDANSKPRNILDGQDSTFFHPRN
jgi:hypothetical protein